MKIKRLYDHIRERDNGTHYFHHVEINGVHYRLHRVVREGITTLIGLQRWHTFVAANGNTDGTWSRVSDRHLVSVLDKEL